MNVHLVHDCVLAQYSATDNTLREMPVGLRADLQHHILAPALHRVFPVSECNYLPGWNVLHTYCIRTCHIVISLLPCNPAYVVCSDNY